MGQGWGRGVGLLQYTIVGVGGVGEEWGKGGGCRHPPPLSCGRHQAALHRQQGPGPTVGLWT